MVFDHDSGETHALSTLSYRIFRALENDPGLCDVDLISLISPLCLDGCDERRVEEARTLLSERGLL